MAAFHRAAESLGLDPTVPRVALAAQMRATDDRPVPNDAELERIALCMSRTAKVAADDLVQLMYREKLVVWMPCIRGDSLLASDKRMGELAERLVGSLPDLSRIGVGMMGQGPAGWTASMDEALRAIEVGSRIAAHVKVHRYSDIVLHESARRSDNVLRYMESLIERLSHEPDLLRTLECYLDQFQQRKRTASTLGIHPNTLNYRLQRIQDMTGGDLDDPAWLSKLHVAVRLRQGSC
jgi:sugar diacid utilization regulator